MRNEGPSEARYTFGDTDTAAARLQLLAATFARPSRSLLATVAGTDVGLAVDLGCGPGFSTQLLVSLVHPRAVAGIDASEAFLGRARSLELAADWHCHDVTAVPLPTGPADLLYARLVLAHVARPEDVLAGWLTQLRPGGHLLVEETEHIACRDPVLAAYEELANALVASQGADLYVGRRLGAIEPRAGYELVMRRVYEHRVPAADAARLFGMNFETWRTDPFVTARYSTSALDCLAADLAHVASSDTGDPVTFSITQLAIRAAS